MTLRSIENMRSAGFDNINVDLIYALPGQSLASWVETMKQIIAWRLESVSVYRLRQHPMKRISKLDQDLYPSYEDGLRMQLAHGLMMGDADYIRVQSHKYAKAREKMQQQTELKRGVDDPAAERGLRLVRLPQLHLLLEYQVARRVGRSGPPGPAPDLDGSDAGPRGADAQDLRAWRAH